MIRLIRVDTQEILLNADYIRSYVEDGQKTLISLTDGEVIEVKNQAMDIMEKIEAWHSGKSCDEMTPSTVTPEDV